MATKYSEYMLKRSGKLVDEIVADLALRTEFVRDDSKETLTFLASESIRSCLESLSSGPEPFTSWTKKLMDDLVEKGWNHKDTLAFIAALRRQLIKESIPAVKDGIEGAEAGALELMWLCDTADRLGVDIFDGLAEKKNAEMRLAAQILNNAVDGAAMADFEGRFRYTNHSLLEMLGYADTDEDLTLDSIFDPGDADQTAITQEVMESGKWEGVLQFKRKDGSKFSGRLVVFPILGPDLKPLGTAAIIRDVTGEVQVEESLQKSQALLQSVIDHMPAIIYVKDLDARYQLVNRHAAELMNLKPENIVGNRDHELFPPEVIAEWRKREDTVMKTRKPYFAEDVFPSDDGDLHYIAAVIPISDSQGEIYAIGGISSDVTELKRSEAARANLQEEVIQAHKQALRELSTPLIPISDDIVVMPLVGPVDSTRAVEILDTLLEGVGASAVKTAIIDLTGVSIVDTQVAEALISAAQAVALLGAEVLVTGISPEVAQTLAQLGIDLSSFYTLGTLKSGISHAMGNRDS